jgi:hypothetical protein
VLIKYAQTVATKKASTETPPYSASRYVTYMQAFFKQHGFPPERDSVIQNCGTLHQIEGATFDTLLHPNGLYYRNLGSIQILQGW